MIGIANIEKLVQATAQFATVVGKVAQGGITLTDLRYLPDAFEVASLFFRVSYSELQAELADLSVQEKEKLADMFRQRFDLPSDSIEQTVEAGVALLLEVVSRLLDMKLLAMKVQSKLK